MKIDTIGMKKLLCYKPQYADVILSNHKDFAVQLSHLLSVIPEFPLMLLYEHREAGCA
jgi:hypothetical protein